MAILLVDSNVSTQLSLDRTGALYYAREGMEAVRSIRNNNWSDLANGSYGLDNSGASWAFSGSPDLIDGKYTRIINISDTYPPATSTKTITSNISWDMTSSRKASSTLTTFLTDWMATTSVATSS